jgi:hypothetical protein
MSAWPLWKTNIDNASNTRISTWMLEQLALRTPKTFHTTIEQDLNPRPCTVNDHPSVLAHEMMTIEPGEKPTHMLTWKTTAYLSHIQPRSHDDRFPISLWETWFCQSLGVPIPALLENPRQCPCCQFSFDHYGDHIQTCQRHSAALPAHEWIVYRISLLLRSVGHRVKTHRITPVTVNERGDIEIQDYVFLPHGEDDRLPPRTLVMDVTMTHDRYGRTTQYTNRAFTHRVSSTGAPQSDGVLNKSTRMKIRHYRHIYADRPDPIVFLPIAVSTSGRVYEDFARLLFLHSHREASILDGELPEESEQFRFLRASRLANLKGSVGLILDKASAMRVTIPIDFCLHGLSYLYLVY